MVTNLSRRINLFLRVGTALGGSLGFGGGLTVTLGGLTLFAIGSGVGLLLRHLLLILLRSRRLSRRLLRIISRNRRLLGGAVVVVRGCRGRLLGILLGDRLARGLLVVGHGRLLVVISRR